MDSQSLNNVLAILRLLRSSNQHSPTVEIIKSWIGPDANDVAVLRVASYLIEQTAAAAQVVQNSQLVEEAKQGVMTTLMRVARVFALESLSSSWTNSITDVNGAISNIVILLSSANVDTQNRSPLEAEELVREVEEVNKLFDDPEIDPVVRDVAKRHLLILATLLRHIPVFGLED
jgi:hypothetical protein